MAQTEDLNSQVEPLAPPKVAMYPSVAEPKELKELMKENILILSGQFAILCQFAHPRLAMGAYKHSNFAENMAKRLRNTTNYLFATVYGTPGEKEAIASVIHRFHSHVKGDGYYADDPELHKWTAATVLVGYIIVYETFLGKIPPEKMQALFKEAAVFATSLRMPPEMWPETLEDFWKYWNYNINTLEVTDMGRSLGQSLLHPVKLPLLLKVGSPLARLLTIHFLPERLAKEYGLEETRERTKGQYRVAVSSIRVAYCCMPKVAKRAAHRHAVTRMQAVSESIKAEGHW